jgi:hypothetical protein
MFIFGRKNISMFALSLLALTGCKEDLGLSGTSNKIDIRQQSVEQYLSCTLVEEGSQRILACPDGSQLVIKDGTDGIDGTNGVDGRDGADGTSCSVSGVPEGALITCGDGTAVLVRHGEQGQSCGVQETEVGALISCGDGSQMVLRHGLDGADGANGADGTSCSVTESDIGAVLSCTDGAMAVVRHGADGADGADGYSCSTHLVEGGAYVECDDGTAALIKNGTDGQDGVDGKDGADGSDAPISEWSIVEVINPCKVEPLDEVILRFANGELMAHYSHGSKQHFALLQPGNYITTDKTNCRFRVTDDLDVQW